jgi:glycosyltransferase involved in cell wall biosynthesis
MWSIVSRFAGYTPRQRREAVIWNMRRYRHRIAAKSSVIRLAYERRHDDRLRRYSDSNPLVSVLIPTYNRAELLSERSVPSVLRQTHGNVEVVVVGDHCTDDTEARLARLRDPRVRFENLAQRGPYPTDPKSRWLVAGSIPGNRALVLARGAWIAWLDDDDEFSSDHVETLLSACLERRLEFAYGILEMEMRPGEWRNVGSWPLRLAEICNASTLYASYLRFFRYDVSCWLYGEPNDWNLWRRMQDAGVRMGFVDAVIGRHHLEHRPSAERASGAH